LIITCERLIHNDEIRRHLAHPDSKLPGDAVCEVPFGAFPGNMVDEYFSDEDHLRLWLESEKEPATFKNSWTSTFAEWTISRATWSSAAESSGSINCGPKST
jgi:hypothetical protein